MLEGFKPVYTPDAKVLILGSMPGQASLDVQEYYAHPRNLFWLFISELVGEAAPTEYEEKLQLLNRNHIALWDVLAQCKRHGSLDSAIEAKSEKVNDFGDLFGRLPKLKRVVFNGRKSEQVFKKHCSELLRYENLEFLVVPSTSPANASISQADKFKAWETALADVLT